MLSFKPTVSLKKLDAVNDYFYASIESKSIVNYALVLTVLLLVSLTNGFIVDIGSSVII